MKKTLFLFATAFILSASLAGCSDNNSKTAEDTAVEDFAKNADENIDMEKAAGTALAPETEEIEGNVGETKVKITDATVIDYNGEDVVVISFEFKNKTGDETTFSNETDVTVYQDNIKLPPAVVVNYEGIDCNTIAQPVKNNRTITVQKAFRLAQDGGSLTVDVNPQGEISDTSAVSRTFNF